MVMRNRRTTIRTILLAIALLLLLAIFVYPIIIVFINSIKPVGEILGAPLSLPKTVQLSNFIQAWKITSMGKLLRNSAILTICSVSAVVVFSAMSAYWCHRYRNAVTRTFTALLSRACHVNDPHDYRVFVTAKTDFRWCVRRRN